MTLKSDERIRQNMAERSAVESSVPQPLKRFALGTDGVMRPDEKGFWLFSSPDGGEAATSSQPLEDAILRVRKWLVQSGRYTAGTIELDRVLRREFGKVESSVPQFVDGYDATFWRDSYRLLSDAVLKHLDQFVHDDDVAEEAIFVDAIEKAGAALAAVFSPRLSEDRVRALIAKLEDLLLNRVTGTHPSGVSIDFVPAADIEHLIREAALGPDRETK